MDLPDFYRVVILGRMEILGYNDKEACSTWLEIDLAIIRSNLRLMEKIAGKPIMPIVKANAYGHGLVETSKAAVEAGANWLGVARIEEALAIRMAGVKCRILILGYTPPKRIMDAIREDIALTVYDRAVASEYLEHAKTVKGKLKIHVKVDTGMGRLGIFPEDVVEFIQWLSIQKEFDMEAVCTHFACADEPNKPSTISQIEEFERVLDRLEILGIKPRLVHAANSSGALNFPNGRYDLIRSGIAMYGLQSSPGTPLPEGFQPALAWKTHLISLKELPAGHGVSYGFHYFTKKNERIGVIAIGYADGFRRRDGNFALVRGKRVPVVGAVCMDQCMVKLDEVPDANIGDEVVLIGKQNGIRIGVEELAEDWGTITYEVICGLADRVPRFYIN